MGIPMPFGGMFSQQALPSAGPANGASRLLCPIRWEPNTPHIRVIPLCVGARMSGFDFDRWQKTTLVSPMTTLRNFNPLCDSG